MDWLSCFASVVGRDLVCGAVNELRYPCCFNNFVEDLDKKEDELIRTRNSVQGRVEHAKKQAMKIDEDLDEWLKQANTEINKGKELLTQARTNKGWCFWPCLDWFWRYRVGKRLAKEQEDIKKCNDKGEKFKCIQFERHASLQHFSLVERLQFDSRKCAYEQLMDALKDDKVDMIGLSGMGGCGKTTLARQVEKKARTDHFFDEVLFVTVSSTIEVGRIQDKIASQLSFPFPEKEESEKAKRLRTRIIHEKRILLILDDVWGWLDFEAIGIPSCKEHGGCKVLITTRSEHVCTLLDCQRKISLQILTDEEAWTLFQKEGHIHETTFDTIKDLGKEISKQCGGLPVAIAAVAATLKGKAEEDWKVALDRLKNSIPVHIEEGLQNPYKCLKLSYDNLNSMEAKSLFLLCSVFPEDYEIPHEFLTRCAIGLGLVGEVHSYEVARNEVSVAKNKLKSSCLLLDVNAKVGECVKMHDLVRDVAHWIAENDKKVIKCVLGVNVNVDSNSLRYLWCNEVPNQLDCSNLEFLRIGTQLEVSDEIFKGMGKLRVLLLVSEKARRPLPAMLFKSLTNLRYLLLHDWELSDILFVEDIKTLESLKLSSCSILEISNVDAVTQLLTKLRLLELYKCDMKMNNFEVIGRLPQLEELYINDKRSEWDVFNENNAEFFNKFSIPQPLQRYRIQLGTKFSGYPKKLRNHRRALLLGCFHTSNETIKGLVKEGEVVYIANIQGGAKNIIPDVFQIGGGNVNDLVICDSKEIECLVNNSNHLSEVGNLFPELLTLRMERMEHLGSLWQGRLRSPGTFEKLERLYIRDCQKLTSLFTPAIARSLVQLKILDISNCDGMKHILADDDKREITTIDHNLVFSKLKWLQVTQCNRLEYIIPITFAQNLLQLESLLIIGARELKCIFGECTHGDQLADQNQNILKIKLPSLKEVQVRDCNKLECIIPDTFAHDLLQLGRLIIVGCCELKYIFGQCTYGDQNQNKLNIELPALLEFRVTSCDKLEYIVPVTSIHSLVQLRSLQIVDCRELKYIFSQCTHGNQLAEQSQYELTVELPALEQLQVVHCDQLEYIIPITSVQSLLELKNLQIVRCRELKYIFSQCTHENQVANRSQNDFKIELPALEYLELGGMPNIIGVFPENVYPTWPSLYWFMLWDCPEFATMSVKTCWLVEKLCDHLSTKDPREIEKQFVTLKRLRLRNSKVEGIFRLNGLEIIEQPVSLGLQLLNLDNLPQMTYVCAASKNSFTFENLTKVVIVRCAKLEVIFPISVIRFLPELKRLEIRECKELKQIIEEDVENHKLPNLLSPQPQPCFPKLTALVVQQCHKLKHLIPIRASNDLQSLELLIINGASELEELIQCEQRQGDEIVKVKVEFSKLKLLIFMQLSSLCQGTELQTVRHRVVHNCSPKLSLTSTTTLQAVEDKLWDKDLEMNGLPPWELYDIIKETTRSAKVTTSGDIRVENRTEEAPKDFPVVHGSQRALGSELPSSQELVDGQSMSEPCLMNQQKPFAETDSTIEILQSIKRGVDKGTTSDNTMIITSSTHSESASSGPLVTSQRKSHALEWDSMPKPSSRLQMNHEDPATSESVLLSSKVKNTKGTPRLQMLDQKLSPNPLPILTKSFDETETAIFGKGMALLKPAIPTSASELRRPSPTSITTPLHNIPSHSIGGIVKESVQEGSISELAAIATSPIDSDLIQGPPPRPLDIPLLKIHSNLVDGQSMGEPCMMIQQKSLGKTRFKEATDQGIQESSKSEKNVTATVSTDSETRNTSPGPLLASRQESNKKSVVEGSTSENAKILTSSTHSEPDRSQAGPLVTAQRKSYPRSEIRGRQTETYTDKESEGYPINIQDFTTNDLISLFQSVEEDGEGQIPTPPVSVVISEHPSTKDNFILKVLADMEESLKMPLKDIASSEANSLRLLTALNFLSHLPLKDVTLSYGLKAIIESMHQEFPSILYYFKQAFATTNKFAVLEAHQNEVAVTLVSKIYKAKNFMDEAQHKEAILKEQILRLEKQIKDCEADLSSLQEEKKKCIAETIGYKKEFENVMKGKSQMVEDQRKARQELFEISYKWSALCSRFEHNRTVARNPS